jgi:hypothetical protein
LVTAGTGAGNPGVLGQPGTTVLFGDERMGGGYRSGIRTELGAWLDCTQCVGIQAGFFCLPGISNSGTFGGIGQPPVSRPFFNGLSGLSDAELVALAGVVMGTVGADVSNGPFLGADLDLRMKLCCGCNYRIDGLVGYRFLYFRDQVSVDENLATTDPTVVPTTFQIGDRFTATNTFHGLDLGLAGSFWYDRVGVDVLARVAFGGVHRDVQIDGSTAVTVAGQTVLNPGGLLALPSNMGRHRSDDFAVVPEIGLGVSYQLAPHVLARFGYTFLYWLKVARAGEQIDPVVNPNLLPPAIPGGPQRPAYLGATESLWVHSLNLGLEITF